MDWTTAIDGYCERTDAGFWSEPVNAISNLAFLAAALAGAMAWRRAARAAPRRDSDLASLFLVVLVGVIGTGSFLFHTFANRWSSLADVLPIAVFIYSYFGLALHRFLGLGRVASFAGTALFLGASVMADDALAGLVGSSSGYVPALAALVAIGALMVFGPTPAGDAEGRLVLGAGLVFALSLSLRMADAPLCETLPLGTHFLWHILNAATLGLLLHAAIRRGPRVPRRRITS